MKPDPISDTGTRWRDVRDPVVPTVTHHFPHPAPDAAEDASPEITTGLAHFLLSLWQTQGRVHPGA